MLKGYTTPRTPQGRSALVPPPPWHFAGEALAVEFMADESKAAAFLPEGLTLASGRCAVYFMDWQYASDAGQEYLDPVCSQYRETLFLISALHEGSPIAYCPFIWVTQDKSMLRGLIQGWPKQMGETWITRAFQVASKAGPCYGQRGSYGAALSVGGRRLVEARVDLEETTDTLPSPAFAGAALLRYFPNLVRERQETPAVHELVRLRSRDVEISTVWRGPAALEILEHPYTELPDLRPVSVLGGYQFALSVTVEDLSVIRSYEQSP